MVLGQVERLDGDRPFATKVNAKLGHTSVLQFLGPENRQVSPRPVLRPAVIQAKFLDPLASRYLPDARAGLLAPSVRTALVQDPLTSADTKLQVKVLC
jgi:hypothetical protein